jgi:hypothetical protein
MQTDGNFVVYNEGGIAVWATGTGGSSGAFLVLQDDGNLVVRDSSGMRSGLYFDEATTGAA